MRRLLNIVLALGLVLSLSLVTAAPALAAPLEAWVDDDWAGLPNGTLVNGHTIGTDAFDNIQDAIDYVFAGGEGGVVHVAAGLNYAKIHMKNGVDVMGAGAGVTIIDAGGSGKAVNTDSVDPPTTIDGFTITGGYTDFGGGVYNYHSSPVVSNCIITGNRADNYGGGMFNEASSPVVVNCIFTGNTAGFFGGGIYIDATSAPTITNCTIVGNRAARGGGIYTTGSLSIITNNIIFNNTATTAGTGGGIHTTNIIPPAIDYNDVYGNSPINYGGTCSAGLHDFNPPVDPKFVVGDPEYHLNSDSDPLNFSPCIDAGYNGAPSIPATDFDGEPRISDGDDNGTATVDMGADEYYVPPPPRRTVGGEVYPVDKTALLLPWLGLGLVLILAAGGLILIRRRS